MGRADHDVHRVRILRNDFWQGFDDELDALVRREQAKSEEHGPLDFESGSDSAVLRWANIRNSVRYEVDLFQRAIVDLDKELHRPLAHHDNTLRELQEFVQHSLLGGVRVHEGRCAAS